MRIYAGIDEAGYGPMFGPLVVGRAVMGLADRHDGDFPPALWQILESAVSRDIQSRKGRVVVNDSKKLRTSGSGNRYLELGNLAFAALAGHRPETVDQWLDVLGNASHRHLDHLPWYRPTDDQPWDKLPTACDAGELAVARGLLANTAKPAGVELLDLGASILFEDQFNQRVAATRSKASVSFTFVAGHLQSIWNQFGPHHPTVVVDRQSGRVRYRSLLMMTFPEVALTVVEENPQASVYQLEGPPPLPGSNQPRRAMTVRFEVEADGRHMPTSLASMISKYSRELMMARFQRWFARRAPSIKPTAGYGSDAKRFWQDIQPVLPSLSIPPERLRRQA